MSEEAVSAAAPHLLEAIAHSRVDIVRTIVAEVRTQLANSGQNHDLSSFSNFLNAHHSEDGTFLHTAVKLCQRDVLRALLQLGADPSVKNASGQTAFECAAAGVKAHELEHVFVTAMMQNIAVSSTSDLERFLSAGVSADATDGSEKRTRALHYAACFGDATTTSALLSAGADVDAVDADGVTALHEAVRTGHADIVRALVEAGADANVTPTNGPLKGISASDLLKKQASDSDLLSAMSSVSLSNSNNINGEGVNGYSRRTSITLSPMRSLRTSICLDSAPPLSPLAPVVTDERLNLLWPQPAYVCQLADEPVAFPEDITITVDPGQESIHKVLDVFGLFGARLGALGRRTFVSPSRPMSSLGTHDDNTVLFCSLRRDAFATSGAYRLTVSRSGRVRMTASDLSGLHYAMATLVQMLALLGDDGLVPVVVADQPQCAVRAVLVDLNPFGRVPLKDTMTDMIETMAALKLNQLQFFMRLSPKTEWSLSYSKSTILALHRFCADRCMDLVPAVDVESNLSHENIEGIAGQIKSIVNTFDNARFLHIGPVLTSLALSKADLWQRLMGGFSGTVMICANSVADPDALPANVIAIQYGFQSGTSFARSLQSFHDEGLSLGVCVGSVAWSSVCGHPDAAVATAVAAHSAMHRLHGCVSVTAHWSSDPALAHFVFAWPAVVVAAGLAWNSDTPKDFIDLSLSALLDAHVFGTSDLGWGLATLDMGRAEHILRRPRPADHSSSDTADSVILNIIKDADAVDLEHIRPEDFALAVQHLRRAQSHLLSSSSSPSKPKSAASSRLESLRHELQLSCELAVLSARIGRALMAAGACPDKNETAGPDAIAAPVVNCGVANLQPTFRTDVANKLLVLVEQYRALWLSRYEASGLQGALRALSNMLAKFVFDREDIIVYREAAATSSP